MSRKAFYALRAKDSLNKIAAAKDLRSLHICTPIHKIKAIELRADIKTVTRLEILKRQKLFEDARDSYTDSKIQYAEMRLELGDSNKQTEKARAMMEHFKRLKSQRLRRLRESRGRLGNA